MNNFKKINYSTINYNFLEIIENWFKSDGILPKGGLAELHNQKTYDLFERKNDQSSIWHKCFYRMIRKEKSFKNVYIKFLKEKIKPEFGEKIVYQKIPTFRVHLPKNISVGEFHKDKHYRNKAWADKVRELNYFVPLTKAYGTNTIWAETEEDKGDFSAIVANYGDCIQRNGTKLTHGKKKNRTKKTRVSFDFRVIVKSRYIESDHLTINTKIPFNIGGYYDVL